MNLTLATVREKHADGTVTGCWLQDRSGTTVAEAEEYAKEVIEVNGNKIEIALFPQCGHRLLWIHEMPLVVIPRKLAPIPTA